MADVLQDQGVADPLAAVEEPRPVVATLPETKPPTFYPSYYTNEPVDPTIPPVPAPTIAPTIPPVPETKPPTFYPSYYTNEPVPATKPWEERKKEKEEAFFDAAAAAAANTSPDGLPVGGDEDFLPADVPPPNTAGIIVPTEAPILPNLPPELANDLPPILQPGNGAAAVPSPVGGGPDALASDATDHPTFHPTTTSFPTYGPTTTFYPTRGSYKDTGLPTFFPSYYTYAPTDAIVGLATPTVAAPTVAAPAAPPTIKPSFEDSEENSFSFTGDPFDVPKTARPVAAPTLGPDTTNKPTRPPRQPTPAPTMANLAGVKGEFRRKSVGFQSNWGPAHPGSMIYDFTRNSIYVTGTAIQPDTSNDFQRSTCFVGSMPIADAELWTMADTPLPPDAIGKVNRFPMPESLKERETMSCHMVYYDDESKTNDNLYVGGVFEKDATDRKGGIGSFLNTFQRSRNNPNWKIRLDPTPLVNPNPAKNQNPVTPVVQYPVAMASSMDQRKDDAVMVLSVASDEPLMTEEYIENGDANNSKNTRNALQPPGVVAGDPSKYAVAKRGANYFMTIGKYMVGNRGLEYKTNLQVKTSNGDIFPAGIINTDADGENFIIVGSNRGRNPGDLQLKNNDIHQDYDGFVTRLYFPRNRATFDRHAGIAISSTETEPALDDFVHGVCPGEVDEKGLVREFYVVGSTYGTLPKGKKQKKLTTNIVSEGRYSDAGIHGNAINRLTAYATKIKNGFPEWTTQLYAINPDFGLENAKTEALGCHLIDSHPEAMYIAGTVYDGGLMDSTQKSAGDDDVWVAKLSTEDGSLQWVRQTGSAGSDKLARTNGIEVDVNGHAIIYGSTTGEMFRRKGPRESLDTTDGSSTDVFVTSFDMMSGESESTIEGDRSASKKGMAGGITAAIIVLIALGCIYFFRRSGRRVGRSRPAPSSGDSNLNKAFQDEPDSEDEANNGGGYSDGNNYSDAAAPPDAAFQDDPTKIV